MYPRYLSAESLSQKSPFMVQAALNPQSPTGAMSSVPASLSSLESQVAADTRRSLPTVPAACLVCWSSTQRRRHLKCDGQRPCSRCRTADLDCVYAASRRGYNGRKRTDAQSSSRRAASRALVPVVGAAVTVVGPAPPEPALEFSDVFDPAMFYGNATSHSSVDTSFPMTAFSQTITSTNLPGFSSQTLVGGTSNRVPRALPIRERYIDSFYLNFYAAHPFIPPKELLLILAQQISLEPLLAAIRWIGSLYIEQDSSRSLFTDASRLIDGAPLRNGFLVQAMLLIIIGLDGNRQEKKARKLMADTRDISIQIKLNSRPFATTNGQGIPILEESWRRTWWELYVVDALMSGVHQTNTFVLYDVPTDVGLPCEENQYVTGQIPPPIYPYDTETLGLFDTRPFSSYTYRIQCACILGVLQKMPSEVDHIARLLANWMLRLPPSKYDAYCNGGLDEMMFQAIMMWQAISILLHQPHSQLDPSLTYYIKPCVSNTPALSSDAFNSHTKHTIRAARELSKLISYRVPLLKHTHFFAYMVTLSSTIHLSRWSLAFVAQDDQDLRQNMGQNIGALLKYAEIWPMAQHLGLQVKQMAKRIYTTKKLQQQQPLQ
ncbi:Zn(II)2Cys6 transcriptional activator [Fusarium acutatum]|uniref:Zn(II)2Cys6 transcriptional activator n=1 Tax=Fusarium acutatum TaxID=78861 RepID=A0A8H4JRM7_9HYPO|nr:Zn(II)2Cys6 transcriptional activator [Fusarium acutatum]